LANDSDPDAGDILSIDSYMPGACGTVVNNNDGTFTCTPDKSVVSYLAPGEFTDDTISYTITDGHGGYDTATVTIRITGVNGAPHAVDDGNDGDSSNEGMDNPITVSHDRRGNKGTKGTGRTGPFKPTALSSSLSKLEKRRNSEPKAG
jgi:VCBS repeat-containing protein